MNTGLEQPQLLITARGASYLQGTCSACDRSFHAFIRTNEEDAQSLLMRGFKLHCRTIHALVIHPALNVEEMVESLPLPAYVCARSTRKLVATNQLFRRVMGYTAEELAELRLDDFRAPEEITLLVESLRRLGGGTVQQRCRTKDGRILRVRVRYQDINLFQNETVVRDARFVVLTNVRAS